MKFYLITLCLLLSSCVTYERCHKKFASIADTDTIYTTRNVHVPVRVPVAYDSTSIRINTNWFDGLDTIVRRSGRALLTIYRRDTSYINAMAECLPDTIVDTMVVTKQVPIAIQKNDWKPPPEKIKLWHLVLVAAGALGIGLLLGAIIK